MELLSSEEMEAQEGGFPSPPPGMALSVFPPAREHYWDPYWWDSAGRDIIRQRHVFDRYEGEEQKDMLREVLKEFPGKAARTMDKAAVEGYAGAIKNLLELGVEVEKNSRVVGKENSVMEEGESEGGDEEFYPLHQACYKGHFKCVKVLVEEAGVEIDARDDLNSTPLLNAAAGGHYEIVKWFLERGADPNLKRDAGMDIIQCAANAGNADTLKAILDSPKLVNPGISYFISLVDNGAYSGNVDTLKLVFERAGFPAAGKKLSKAQVKTVEECIYRVIDKKSMEAFQFLLSYLMTKTGNNAFAPYEFVDIRNKFNVFNSTEVAINNTEIFQLAWEVFYLPFAAQHKESEEGRPNYEQCLNRRLISAAQNGALETLKLILEKYGANVNHISHKYHATPLLSATAQGYADIASYLLEHGADIHLGNGKYANGPTALHNTVRNGPKVKDAAMLLLRHGGPVESLDETMQQVVIGTEMVAVAVETYRAPVFLRTKVQHEAVMADSEERSVSFTVEEGDMEWLQNLQIRRRDERLKEGKDGRKLMIEPEARGGDDHWPERMGLL